MVTKFFLKEEVSSVWSILAFCRSGGIQSEVVCSYKCLGLCKQSRCSDTRGNETNKCTLTYNSILYYERNMRVTCFGLLWPSSGKCFTKDGCIKILLDQRILIAEKFPDDGTLPPKHVGFGARYEVCFIIYFIVI